MSMDMTWLDFQLSTNNQNDHQLAINFLFIWKLTYLYVFGVCESIGIIRFHVRRKRGCGDHLDFINFKIPCAITWELLLDLSIFYPSAIKAVEYSDHQRRAGSQKFSSY